MKNATARAAGPGPGFTLIELLVVVAIIMPRMHGDLGPGRSVNAGILSDVVWRKRTLTDLS